MEGGAPGFGTQNSELRTQESGVGRRGEWCIVVRATKGKQLEDASICTRPWHLLAPSSWVLSPEFSV
jgi:hypothetical protein